MMRILPLLSALLLAGCIGNVRQDDVARYDLGVPPATAVAPVGIAVVEVAAPSWLAGSAMQYRLLYADAARRQSYADSRWAAPPAELLERALERRLAGQGRCRLKVELDEMSQVFDTPGASRMVVEGRAVLTAGREVLASRTFALAPAAPSADARGGVAAATAAVKTLGDHLAGWLAGFGERCRD